MSLCEWYLKVQKESMKFNSLQVLPPDISSLQIKIMRANYVSYLMSNCLNPRFTGLNPLNYGWKLENDNLVPIWFLGPCLSSNEETYFEIIDSYIEEHENTYESDEEIFSLCF